MMRGKAKKDVGYSKVIQDVLDTTMQKSMLSGGTGEESSICHICSAQLKTPKAVRDHILASHLAFKAHRCSTCGEAFTWPNQLTRHKKRVHGMYVGAQD